VGVGEWVPHRHNEVESRACLSVAHVPMCVLILALSCISSRAQTEAPRKGWARRPSQTVPSDCTAQYCSSGRLMGGNVKDDSGSLTDFRKCILSMMYPKHPESSILLQVKKKYSAPNKYAFGQCIHCESRRCIFLDEPVERRRRI